MNDALMAYDFAQHYVSGGDPDSDCARLASWHVELWAQPFARLGGHRLTSRYDGGYEFALTQPDGTVLRLASDGMLPTWARPELNLRSGFSLELIEEIGRYPSPFFRAASTMGGYILFPRNSNGQTGNTINQARGTRRSISDRFDLTLECIRRHYESPSADNPLADRLAAYGNFFSLFSDFPGYVDFWLLNDLVTDRHDVRSLMDNQVLTDYRFDQPAVPRTAGQYRAYREHCLTFLQARNDRMQTTGRLFAAVACRVCGEAEPSTSSMPA